MDIFLEKRNYNKIEIFKYLCTHTNGCNVSVLGAFLTLSNNSISRSLIELSIDLNTLPSITCTLENNQGIFSIANLANKDISHTIDTLMLHYLEQSIPFTTLTSIITTPFKSAEQLSEELMISSSYYYKMLRRFKPIMNSWHLNIDYSSNNSNIIGSPLHLRYFMFYIFWYSFKNVEWPFSHLESKSKYLQLLDTKISNRLSTSEKLRLLYNIAIFDMIVIHQNNYINLNLVSREIMQVFQKNNDTSIPIKKLLVGVLATDDMINDELLFFNFITRFSSTNLDSAEQKIEIGKNLILLENPIITYSKKLLSSVINHFHLQCSEDSFSLLMYYTTLYCFANVNLDINYHIFIKPHPSKELVGFKRQRANSITNEIVIFLNNFNQNYPDQSLASKNFNYPDASYNFIYFIILYLEIPTLKIYVHYSKNIHSECLIKKKLLSIFNNDSLTIVNTINDADVILSDSTEAITNSSLSYFFINEITEAETWVDIINYVTKLLILKNLHL